MINMIQKITYLSILIVFIVIGTLSCKKKASGSAEQVTNGNSTVGTNTTPAYNSVSVNFTNVWGGQILQLSPIGPYSASTPRYVNANNDTCSVSQCRYYISNIRFKRSDNTYYTEDNSYHLVEQLDTTNTCKFSLANVPVGNYSQIEFMIGVDSTRNCSGAKTGALDPVHGMFWSWAQGYILFQFEGYSNQAGASSFNNLVYHLGGFSAPYNNLKTIKIPLIPGLSVVTDHVSKIYLKADISETFKTPLTLNFAVDKYAMQPASSKKYADNYADMFSLAALIN